MENKGDMEVVRERKKAESPEGVRTDSLAFFPA
jgi:hypothetical protein